MNLWNSKREVINMSPHTGRPKVDNPKRNDVKVRLDDETSKRLDIYCAKNNIKRAEAIRKGIYVLLAEQK